MPEAYGRIYADIDSLAYGDRALHLTAVNDRPFIKIRAENSERAVPANHSSDVRRLPTTARIKHRAVEDCLGQPICRPLNTKDDCLAIQERHVV